MDKKRSSRGKININVIFPQLGRNEHRFTEANGCCEVIGPCPSFTLDNFEL